MESKDLKALSELYLQTVYEDKKYGYDKDGNSLNPADIEERKRMMTLLDHLMTK